MSVVNKKGVPCTSMEQGTSANSLSVALWRGSRTRVHTLQAMRPPESGLQDRCQFSSHWEEAQERWDGERTFRTKSPALPARFSYHTTKSDEDFRKHICQPESTANTLVHWPVHRLSGSRCFIDGLEIRRRRRFISERPQWRPAPISSAWGRNTRPRSHTAFIFKASSLSVGIGVVRLTWTGSFFRYYHPFLPFLEPDKTPDEYYAASPLLFWVIVAVAARRYEPDPTLFTSLAAPVSRLLWATLESVPQSYFVVKALCIVCTWPTPISSTSADPTFMLSGMMMQIAKQIGLHRPSHAQDFTKFKVELREEELKDRVRTWATCNVVAQR